MQRAGYVLLAGRAPLQPAKGLSGTLAPVFGCGTLPVVPPTPFHVRLPAEIRTAGEVAIPPAAPARLLVHVASVQTALAHARPDPRDTSTGRGYPLPRGAVSARRELCTARLDRASLPPPDEVPHNGRHSGHPEDQDHGGFFPRHRNPPASWRAAHRMNTTTPTNSAIPNMRPNSFIKNPSLVPR
jgi:hypothetical protein